MQVRSYLQWQINKLEDNPIDLHNDLPDAPTPPPIPAPSVQNFVIPDSIFFTF